MTIPAKADVDEAVGDGVERDIAGIKAELQQYFLDSQILHQRFQHAIEYGARV